MAGKSRALVPRQRILDAIVLMRGQKVMLDATLSPSFTESKRGF